MPGRYWTTYEGVSHRSSTFSSEITEFFRSLLGLGTFSTSSAAAHFGRPRHGQWRAEVVRCAQFAGTANRPYDVGLRKEIDPNLRADILRTAEEFRRALGEADQWEANRRVTEYGSHLTLQP